MNKAWFEYKGVDSRDMHIQIVNDISFPSPEADIDFIEVLGRDGELAIDNKRLKGANFPIPIRLKLPQDMDVNTIATEISEWLKNDVGWHTLKFSGSLEYEYIAICYEQFDILETLKQYGKTVITFRLKPYKRRIDSRTIEIENGSTLINPEKRTSKPLINIEGNGDISFKNNDKDWLVLSNVEGKVTVDSELMSIYKDDINQFNKMNGELIPLFPQLTSGENKITWTGDVTKIEINPRWEAVT